MSNVLKARGGLLAAVVSVAALLFACALAGVHATPAFASTPPDPSKECSITVSPKSELANGSEITLYRVASAALNESGDGLTYTLTDAFAASGATASALASDDGELAGALNDYAKKNGVTATQQATASAGKVTFTGLSAGIYLIVQNGAESGESVLAPFLVAAPQLTSGTWVYSVTANPKAEPYETVDVTVVKVWNDGGAEAARPQSVTVSLHRGGVLVGTVVLNAENNWTYTWSDLAESDQYSVTEAEVEGYVATYTKDGYTLTITNTGDAGPDAPTPGDDEPGSDEPGDGGTPGDDTSGGDTGDVPSSPTLAQTGQLNWPVPLLALGGVVLFGIGWAIAFLKRKKHA